MESEEMELEQAVSILENLHPIQQYQNPATHKYEIKSDILLEVAIKTVLKALKNDLDYTSVYLKGVYDGKESIIKNIDNKIKELSILDFNEYDVVSQYTANMTTINILKTIKKG